VTKTYGISMGWSTMEKKFQRIYVKNQQGMFQEIATNREINKE
jgi:hypothetical protein